jgi:hypothetical protein
MRLVLGLLILLGTVLPAAAVRTVEADKPIGLRLAVGELMVVALPETIGTVMIGGTFTPSEASRSEESPDTPLVSRQISFQKAGATLGILLVDATYTGRFFVIGVSGRIYTVVVKVATPSDDVVYVTLTPPKAATPAPPLGLPSFLRALATHTPLPGQQPIDVPAPTLGNPRLALVESTAVAWGPTVGLTLTLQNAQPRPVALDLRVGAAPGPAGEDVVALSTWVWPPRYTVRALTCDPACSRRQDIVPPESTVELYVVLEKRS